MTQLHDDSPWNTHAVANIRNCEADVATWFAHTPRGVNCETGWDAACAVFLFWRAISVFVAPPRTGPIGPDRPELARRLQGTRLTATVLRPRVVRTAFGAED
jgi:hypothetical protein